MKMKRFVAGALTAVLMGVLLWSGLRAPRSDAPATPPAGETEARSGEASPAEARVHALLKSGSEGDVSAYLDSFTGPLRMRLEREVNERGQVDFAEDLRRAARSRKSHAVFAGEPDGPGSARVTVETVYPDRNERQTYRLDRTDGGWLVAGVETVRSHQPKAKFGAPAVYVAPEGVPVQGGVIVETGEESRDTAGSAATDSP